MTGIEIRLLGPFEVSCSGEVVKLPGRKVRALLALLALSAGETVSFDSLARGIWDENPPERVRGSLQTYVGRLRRALGDQVVATEPTGYRLCLPESSVDALVFRALVTDPGPGERGRLDEALALWRGDPFGETLSDWIERRESPDLIERYLAASERRIDLDLAAGRPADCIRELRDLTGRYPLRETLWVRLLTALRSTGRKAEALDRYEALRTTLAEELGADPSPELQALHRDLLTEAPPALVAQYEGPVRRVPSSGLTRFFGRQAELAQLGRLTAGARLVTMAGAPGAGKTRLAREFGLTARFRDGAVLVELAPASDNASVLGLIAVALDVVVEEPGGTLERALVTALAGTELLLILDNCEHVVDAAAEIAEQLLAGCPRLTVLTTSRVPLGVPGEQVYRLPPLAEGPAAELFTDRAGLLHGELEQPEHSEPVNGEPGDSEVAADRGLDGTVNQICRQLDGLPLAIELAAAWSHVLSPAQLLERLVPILTGAHPHGRQRTIGATLDWSYQLLTPAQQLLFDRLAVFKGGFDLSAAEAVSQLQDDLLRPLTALVDHSLVLATRDDDGMRYRMLEPVRQYGELALAARGESAMIRERHAAHYLTVARRCDAGLRGPDRSASLIGLQREEGNLLSALNWARTKRDDLGLQLCTALAYFWEQRGYINDARARLEEFLEHHTADPRLRAGALARLGRLAWRQRDYPAAKAQYEESLAIMREFGDELGAARGLRNVALVAATTGDLATAVDLCEQSIALFSRHGDDQGRGSTLTVLGLAQYENDVWDRGRDSYLQALEASRTGKSAALAVVARLGVAFFAAVTGDRASHRAHLAAVIAEVRMAGGLLEDPEWLWAGTSLAVSEQRAVAALRLAGAATALSRRGGRMPDTMTALCDAAVRKARRQVGARTAERLMAEGRRMTQDELMAEALAPPTFADRPLTAREHEVAGLTGQGLNNEQIATVLRISRRTVESHLEHVKQKLDLRSRYEIVAWALSNQPSG